MRHKKAYVGALALGLLASFSLGVSMMTLAESEIDASKFTMYKGASVRTEGTTAHPNAQGLRFMTYATEFKAELEAVYSPYQYDYNWYTQLRFSLKSGSSVYTPYETNVPTSVWHANGWNTVLLNIPTNAVAVDITAQSFVEVKNANGDTVYGMNTEARTYSAAETASWALAYTMYQNDTQKQFLESYVQAAVDSGEIQALNLSRPTFGVEVGCSDYLVANTMPFGYGITYTSANEDIATVDGNGRVTGVAAGETTITLSVGSLTKTCKVTVVEKDSVPAAITSWTNTDNAWIYTYKGGFFNLETKYAVNDISSQMYPFYHRASDSTYDNINTNAGTGQVVNGKIKLVSSKTAYYTLNSEYLANVFALSKVKAVRMKLTGLSNYQIAQFKLNYGTLTDEHIRYEKSGDVVYLQFNRSAYETYLNTRASDTTEFIFRLQFQAASDGVAGSGTSALVNPTYYIEEIAPIYDSITEDFEFGANSAITTDAESAVEKISERTNGRGMYAMSAQPAGNSLTVNIASAYVNKVFNSGATTLQFRVYTDKDLASVKVNTSTTDVQYVYNADGEYYTIRIGSGYKNNSLAVVLIAESAFGKVYLDAFTGTDNTIGENRTKSGAYAKDNGGEIEFEAGQTFNFYAYGSMSDGVLDGADYNFDEPTLENMLQLKAAGFDAIMPQSEAPVGEDGATRGAYSYLDILDLAEQAGLKVILTDDPLLYLSAGKQYDASGANWSNWKGYYESAKETSGEWVGAAKSTSTMYAKVKSQLQSYINHPAFGGVLMVDEPRIWMLDESVANGQEYTKSGAFGFTYKTVKRVAQEVFGKDIFIHANVLPAGDYSHFNKHTTGQLFPELTVARYGELTGMAVSGYAVDSNGYATGSTFYTDLENYIELIGATDAGKGNNSLACREVKMQIMRERYGAYCKKFLEATGADYLMPDIYPIYGATPTDRHLLEIQTAAEVAAAYGADLHLITQSMMHIVGTNATLQREFTESDARWLNNILLSYGVKNIVYFTYHVHGNDGSGYFDKDSSFVDETGEKTKIWYFMQQIMSENKAFASTYQAFDIQSIKTYYNTLSVFNGEYGYYSNDVNFNDGSLYANDTVTFTALTSVKTSGEFTTISEYKNENGAYMYAITNMTDGKYANDYTAYQTTTLTFGAEYSHVILWRNGEKKLVALDENHSLEIENAAGEAVYVIPYKYIKNDGLFEDATDNGIFFPGSQWAGNAW